MHAGDFLTRAARRWPEAPAWLDVEALPRNAYGKIPKREPRARYWTGRARRT